MCVCLFKMLGFLVGFLFCIQLVTSLEIGDKCRLSNEIPGTCASIYKCPTALNSWDQDALPEMCNFKGKEPIVCCPKYEKNMPKLSKSEQKCMEYGNSLSRFRRHRAGGSPALPHEFTHMAALGYEDGDTIKWYCGGTLISDEYVLTAAHCLTSREFGDVKYIRIGDVNLENDDDDVVPQDFTIVAAIPHPNYKKKLRYNDIALIKLNRKANFNEHVHPACLYTDFQVRQKKLTAIGWALSEVLRKVDMDLYEDITCRKYYKFLKDGKLNLGILSESQMCAGGFDEVRDTCRGDSGGPLLLPNEYHPNLFYVVGVTSFGRPCGNPNTPGVYTRVSHFIPWIEAIVWP